MTAGWQIKKVSEISTHSLGKMLDKAKNKGQPKPYLRNLNVRWFDFDLSNVLEMRFLPEEEARYTAVKGDVLICEGGYPGRAAIWQQDEPIYFQKALHRVRFHEPERNEWFLYFLLSKDLDDTLKNHFNGAGIQHFTGKALAQFEVPLPPLPEQRRIIGILNEAFDGIAIAKANAERNQKNANELFEVQREAKFEEYRRIWPGEQLGKVAEVKSGGTPLISTRAFWGGNIPWYSSGELNNLTTSDPERFITNAGLNGSNAKLFPTGSLLVGMYDTAALKMSILDRDAAYNQAIAGVKPNKNLAPEFVMHAINVDRFKILSQRRGVRQKNLSLGKIKEIVIPVPPIEVQLKFIGELRSVHEEAQTLRNIYDKKLAALDELKRSLLYSAFNGGL